MLFLKDLFKKDDLIIGLSGLKKEKTAVNFKIPETYKNTYITNTSNNYILF